MSDGAPRATPSTRAWSISSPRHRARADDRHPAVPSFTVGVLDVATRRPSTGARHSVVETLRDVDGGRRAPQEEFTLRNRLSRVLGCAAAATLVSTAALAGPAGADPNNNNARKLTKAVTLDGLLEHLAAFQAIADANGGNRAAGLPGYAGSVEYVVERLEAAGYDPIVQEFEFDFFDENSELQRISPNPRDFVNEDRLPPQHLRLGHPRGRGDRSAVPGRAGHRPDAARQLQHERL